MHCFIRSSKSKGRAHRSLIERFWKGLDCSTMPSKTNLEGNKPFRKEFHGPGHPGGGNHPPPGGKGFERVYLTKQILKKKNIRKHGLQDDLEGWRA